MASNSIEQKVNGLIVDLARNMYPFRSNEGLSCVEGWNALGKSGE